MRFLYSIAISFYSFLVSLASPFNTKAKQWYGGRKNVFEQLSQQIKSKKDIIWIHASSVGEFEQARPLIEKIKRQQKKYSIVLTFYSPSVYELRKDYALADYIFYLPADTRANARKFLEIVQPQMVFFIKYEFWFNYINQIHINQIPLYLVSGIFRPRQHFFKVYGFWFRKHLKMFTHLFVQDKRSADLLQNSGVFNYSIAGDTRFDRVYNNTLHPHQYACIKRYSYQSDCLLAGSTWPADEQIIANYLKSSGDNFKLIIAPHEVNEAHLQSIEKLFKPYGTIRWSHDEDLKNLQGQKVLIIDSVGKLMHLYQYAKVAYIGGGFGVGIHNILEAACFAKPTIIGPNYYKFKEARDLIALGGAFSISEADDFKSTLNKLFSDHEFLKQKSAICENYVKDNIGATGQIFSFCFGE